MRGRGAKQMGRFGRSGDKRRWGGKRKSRIQEPASCASSSALRQLAWVTPVVATSVQKKEEISRILPPSTDPKSSNYFKGIDLQ
jgi:hypothetical protein